MRPIIAQFVWLAVALFGFAVAAEMPDYFVFAEPQPAAPDYTMVAKFGANPELAVCPINGLNCDCGCLEGGLCLCGIGPVEAKAVASTTAAKRYSYRGGKWVASANGTHTGEAVGGGKWRYTPIARPRARVYQMLPLRGGNCAGGVCR